MIGALATIAFAVVWLRAEQTRVAARMLGHEYRWVQKRRELWAVQAEVARLRTPHAVRDRVERVDRFEIGLVPPEPEHYHPGVVLVSDQPQE